MSLENRAKLRYILAVFIFGTNGLLLHYISLPSEVVVLARGTLGALFLFGVILAQGRKPDQTAIRDNLKWLLLSGVSTGLNWLFLFGAYRNTSVAVASLCNYMAPVIMILLAPIVFRERLRWQKMLCVLAALVGIAFVSGVISEPLENLNLKGIGLGLAAALGFAASVLFTKKIQGMNHLDKVMIQMAVAALTVLPFVLIRNPISSLQFSGQTVLLMLVIGIVNTGLGYYFFYGPMDTLPVQTIAALGYIEPVVSVLCSTLLHEPLDLLGWIGAALILGSAAASELIPQKERLPREKPCISA